MINKDININIFKDHCCGCGECKSICSHNAIVLKNNEQGFLYPNVNSNLCVNCGICVNRCSFNNKEIITNNITNILEAYAVKHKNEEIRMSSRSGGIFTALSDKIFKLNGVVYGFKLINNNKAVHCRATTKDERDTFKGSKYIQSELHDDIYNSIKQDLLDGLWVLFSGTPCQVNAVKDFCKFIDCTKLLLIDIVCHGVPSPKVWSDYLNFICGKKRQVVSVDFRDKLNFGWEEHKETIIFSNSSLYSGEIFKNLFYDHYILRRDCFSCSYKSNI